MPHWILPLLPSDLVAMGSPAPLVAANGASSLMQFLPIILMFLVVWLLVLRPMKTQENDRRKRLQGLKKGDQVVLAGGVLGRISNYDDPKIAVVEIADRVKIRVLKKEIADTQAEALKEKEAGGLFGGPKAKPPAKEAAASEETSTEAAPATDRKSAE